MKVSSGSSRFWVLSGLILVAVASRWLPHAPNMTPVMAMALFAGAFFTTWQSAVLVPLLGLAVSDLVLGVHSQILPVYLSFGLAVGIGRWVGNRSKQRDQGREAGGCWKRLPVGVLFSSGVFFLISNFFVWAFDGMYPLTSAGLVECYVMAIPFFHADLIGNLIFSTVFFGTWAVVSRWVPASARQS